MSYLRSVEIAIPHSTNQEDFSLYLPRNLSYVEESPRDIFSVSANFVHNPQIRLCDLQSANIQSFQSHSDIVRLMMTEMQTSTVDSAADTLLDFTISAAECKRQTSSSDTADSEEGVFLNMLDDLDSLESETLGGVSLCSDDFAVDSINSPDEDDQLARDQMNDDLSEAVSEAMAKSDDEAEEEQIGQPAKKPQDPLDLKIAINDVPLAEAGSEKSLFNLMGTNSPMLYEDREFNFTKSELRKSRSLKTNKTPPGTPHRKKVVRFADAMGLDLESVRHILNLDSPPKIPASAMKDLQVGLGEDRKSQGSVYLTVTFPQPGASYTFVRKVLDQKVCLENAVVTDLTITGFVRVANVGFHKSVRIRYSTNSWESFYDIAASYVQNSCDGPTDRFSFSIVAPSNFTVGSKLEFAISFNVNDNQYWDSNDGKNYVFLCYAKTIPSENDNSWMHFL